MRTHRWRTSLTTSADPETKGWQVWATDRLLPYPQERIVRWAGGITRFPLDVAERIADYLADNNRPPPSARLISPPPAWCRLCGSAKEGYHLTGCFQARGRTG